MQIRTFKNTTIFLARQFFRSRSLASISHYLRSILYIASPSSLQSGNICKSIFCSVFLPSLGFSSHVFSFIFLVEPRSIALAFNLSTSTGSSSLYCQRSVSSEFLDVASKICKLQQITFNDIPRLTHLTDYPRRRLHLFIIILKQYIYTCKCLDKKPNMQEFQRKAVLQCQIEKCALP